MKNALEALERIGMKDWVERKESAIAELKQAISEIEKQEPVYLVWLKAHCAWLHTDKEGFDKTADDERWMLYTTPPEAQQEWVGLTESEISLGAFNTDPGDWNDLRFQTSWHEGFQAGADFARTELKQKNTKKG